MILSGWKWPGWKSRRRQDRAEIALIEDPWAAAPRTEREETSVSLMLSDIEAAACAVYARHGLPDRPGHYARSPKSRAWRFLSETLTAEERFALVLAQKDGSKWRFGSLENLGDQADSPPDLRRAAEVLRSCHRLRARLAETGSPSLGEDLEAAIGLGAAWRQLDAGHAPTLPRMEPLKLTMPSKPAPKIKTARRKPAAKPKP
ncbi:hypothetical protein BH09PSE1_BH09PSE1_15980 [soil metagenome]